MVSNTVLQKKNLALIQLLRGVASILVVLLHITTNFSETLGRPFLGNVFLFGGSGVDIFFVLSGFIITYSHLNWLAQPKEAIPFVKKRIVRIYPIYWIVISAFLILQLVFSSYYKSPFSYTVPNVLKTYLLLPAHIMVNGVSWSLTNELFFYLLFFAAILIPWKKLSLLLLMLYTLLLILNGVTGLAYTGGGNTWLDVLLFPMNIEFFLGVLVAFIIRKISSGWLLPFLVFGCLAFIAGAILRNNGVTIFEDRLTEGIDRVILFGIPSFFIVLAVVGIELRRQVSVNNIFLQLGDASYSIYLLHLPFVAAFYKIVAKLGISNTIVLYLLSLMLFVFICLLGILVYKKIEKPMIKRLNKAIL